MDKFYITTPIYYVNDQPHIGHAYTTLAADVLARWHKMKRDEVFFLTGTDEHGAKIAAAAAAAKKPEQKFVDEKTQAFKNIWQKLNIQYDNFLRTTDQKHIQAVEKTLQILYDRNFIYKGEYEGLYCVSCEQYKAKDDLIDGKCAEHNIEPVLMKEESYFFKLSEFQRNLENKISSNEFEIQPEQRKNEVLSFIRRGLKDISISRKNVKWGIPLPFDKSYTTYVWVDAFLNYLTGLGWPGKADSYPEMWPPAVQLMSKDILRVHATIWPGILLAFGFPLPKKFFVHGYFTISGQKMSKSLGNVIWPEDLIEKFGVDGTRYLLMSSLSYGQDGDITFEKLKEKYNADLANGIGNTLNRVLTIAEKYNKGIVPEYKSSSLYRIKDNGEKIPYDYNSLEEHISRQVFSILNNIDEDFEFDFYLKNIIDGFKKIDKEIEEVKPWDMWVNDTSEAEYFLYSWLEAIRLLAYALLPFLPETAENIFTKLGLNTKEEELKHFEEVIKWGGLKPGIKIRKGEILFKRI